MDRIEELKGIRKGQVGAYSDDAVVQEILLGLHDAIIDFDEDETVALCKRVEAEKKENAYLCVMEGLAAGMHTVGDLYEEKIYFVPEVLMCSDALYAGLDILRPLIPKGVGKVIGAVVIGVLEGDVHDIGKNLIKMMFDVAGWTVYDLGKDVPLEKFVEEQVRTDSDIVGLSALMTTSMVAMPEIVKKLKEKNPKVRIMLGGAPVTPELVEKYGADGYAKSAGTAVDEAIKLIKMLKEEEFAEKK